MQAACAISASISCICRRETGRVSGTGIRMKTSSLLQGELVLIEDEGETLLRAGDCAAFPKGTGNGHHMINRSAQMAVYLEAGSRVYEDMTTCSDVDMKSANADGRFVRKDGSDIR
jgi:uncharacterized cupin superfamily protein